MSAITPVWRRLIHLAVRLFPAGILVWSGVAKLVAGRQNGILSVDAYDVLPSGLVEPVAILLPWVELAIAALLILGLFTRFAGFGLAGLSAVFIAGMAQAKARGLKIDCGCFGVGGAGEGVSWFDILRDVPLLAAGVFLAWWPEGPCQLDNRFRGEDLKDDEGDVALERGDEGTREGAREDHDGQGK